MDKISFSPIYTPLEAPAGISKQKKYTNNDVDMKDLYSPEELDNIVSKFNCLHTTSIDGSRKCEFDMVYNPEFNSVIINNRNMTNDTVEIYKNGRAISVGSWHQKTLDGNYSDIINDAKSRYEALKKNGNELQNNEIAFGNKSNIDKQFVKHSSENIIALYQKIW